VSHDAPERTARRDRDRLRPARGLAVCDPRSNDVVRIGSSRAVRREIDELLRFGARAVCLAMSCPTVGLDR
jgi:hypothetical protein